MRIVIAGAGAVGGYYGAMLFKAGHEVFFIARGDHLEAIRRDGLTVKSVNGDFSIRPECGENSEGFGAAEMVLVCFKAYGTASTTGLYASSVGPDTAIISLQNGVDNEPVLARAFSPSNILGGIAFIGSEVVSPGIISHTAFGAVSIGEVDSKPGPRVQKIEKVFLDAGIKCKISENITKDMYQKMVWNTGFNAVCAILDCSAGEAVRFGPTKKLVKDAMLELIDVAHLEGVELDPELAQRNVSITLEGGRIIPSMAQDKRNGRRMEIESFNGKVESLGEKHGVKTPVNSALASVIRFYNFNLGFDS